MSARRAVLLTLARDVVVAASRRRTLWYYLLASTAVAGVVVLGADVSVVVRREEPGGPLPRTVAFERPLLPGSVAVEAGDQREPDHLALDDDGHGHLVAAGSPDARGTIDYARGVVSVAPPDVAAVRSLAITAATSLTGLTSGARARLLDEGHATYVTIFGQMVGDDLLPPRRAAPHLLTSIVFRGLLVWVAASFFGVLLGLLATADAVSSALEPGAAELLLSRPVHRVDVVLGRFLGALAFGALQLGWLLGLAVVLAGLKFDLWLPGVFAALPLVLLQFAILAAIASLATVVTRTNALGLAAAAAAWAASFAVDKAPADLVPGVALARRLVPQVTQLDAVAAWALDPPGVADEVGAPIVVALALAWIVVPLALTAWVVARRDL